MDHKGFGKFVKESREKVGIETREELSRLSKISAPTLFRIEVGKTREPSLNTLRKLATALGISEEEIIRKAGYLPENVSPKELEGYVSAVEDFSDGLTADEIRQVNQYKRFLVDQRGKK